MCIHKIESMGSGEVASPSGIRSWPPCAYTDDVKDIIHRAATAAKDCRIAIPARCWWEGSTATWVRLSTRSLRVGGGGLPQTSMAHRESFLQPDIDILLHERAQRRLANCTGAKDVEVDDGGFDSRCDLGIEDPAEVIRPPIGSAVLSGVQKGVLLLVTFQSPIVVLLSIIFQRNAFLLSPTVTTASICEMKKPIHEKLWGRVVS
jgi:hypothetical protein